MTDTYSATFYLSDIIRQVRESALALSGPGEPCQIPIILSCVAIEAFLNEITEELRLGMSHPPPETVLAQLTDLLPLAQQERASVRFRMELVHAIATGQRLEKGKQPYQDYALAVRLRNALVHAGPVVNDPADRDQRRIPGALRTRGLISEREASPNYSWRAAALQPKVATWCFNASVEMIQFLARATQRHWEHSHVLRDVLRVDKIKGTSSRP